MKISIRTFITVPFLFLTFAPAGVVGWLSYTNSQQAIAKIADDLIGQISNQVRERVQVYLTTSHFLNQLNAGAIESGELNLDDTRGLELHFVRQFSAAFLSDQTTKIVTTNNEFNRSINHIYIGTEAKGFFGAEYRPRDQEHPSFPWIIAVSRADQSTHHRLLQYEYQNGTVAKVPLEPGGARQYDPTARPWYRRAKELDTHPGRKAGWSPVYCDRTTATPVITAVRPIRLKGKFRGVLGSDFLFSDVQDFLKSLLTGVNIGTQGEIFILDQNNNLLISSNDNISQCDPYGKVPLRRAQDLKDSIISKLVTDSTAIRQVKENRGQGNTVLKRYKNYFWNSWDLNDRYGLRWTVYIVIKEAHFMADINSNNRVTYQLCLAAIVISAAFSLLVSQRIINPILKLERATRELATSIINDEQDIQDLNIANITAELNDLAHTFEIMSTQLRKSFIAFGQFVPYNFLHALGYRNPTDVKLGDSKVVKMTILFADIRSFTKLSEAMKPAENFQFINEYLKEMEPAITSNGGFIDKYIGDAIMALFEGGDSADHAVKAGIDMLRQLHRYNQIRCDRGQQSIEVGIGIHTGEIILGTVGGEHRWDTTVIGRDVNLASRLEGLTKEFQVSLLISRPTLEALKNQYNHRNLGAAKVKGLDEEIVIYEIYNSDIGNEN